jgi:hypothetical protein
VLGHLSTFDRIAHLKIIQKWLRLASRVVNSLAEEFNFILNTCTEFVCV